MLKHPSLWAEDANVFYGPLINDHANLIRPDFSIYANQHWVLIHYIARLVYFSSSGSLEILPLISCVVSLSLTLLMATMWLNSTLLVKNQKNRVLIFGFILLAPSSWESLGNLANSYVYFFIGIFAISGWVLPKKRSHLVYESICFVMLSLTSICGIFVIVSLIFRAILNRSKMYTIIPITLTFFLLPQFKNWMQRGPGDISLNLLSTSQDVLYIIIKRIGAETLLGQNGGGGNFSSIQGWIAWSAIAFMPLLLVLTTVVFFLKHATSYDLVKIVTVVTLSGIHFVLYILASINTGLNQLFLFGAGGRYLLVTHVSIFALVIIVYDHFQYSTFNSKAKLWTNCTLLVATVAVCFDFILPSKTTPDYQLAWKNYSRCIAEGHADCAVSVPPGSAWGINLETGNSSKK